MSETSELLLKSSIELTGLEGSIDKILQIQIDLDKLAERAHGIEVHDPETYAQAGQIIGELKQANKQVEAELAPYEIVVARVKGFLLDQRKSVAGRVADVTAVLSAKMRKWSQREKELAEIEAAKLNRGKKADHAEVVPNIPALAGVRRHTNYYAECVDDDAFLVEFITRVLVYADIPFRRAKIVAAINKPTLREYVTVNNQKLGELARSLKDSKKTETFGAGIRAWQEEKF